MTTNGRQPADRFNGPVTFIDRTDEWNLGQLYLLAERETHTDGCGFDLGGRVDLLYGTDSRFVTAHGLDDSWIGGQRFYSLAMPQLYVDLALDDWVLRVGHFYSNLDYEVVPAVDNFFHSHTYAFQYGEPITLTGLTARRQLTDRLSVMAGLDQGWDRWTDNNDKLGFVGGLAWKNEESGTSVALGLTAGNEQAAQASSRTMYSIVFQQQLSRRWRYVFEHQGGQESNALVRNGNLVAADWCGVTNYLLFDVDSQWSFGLRYEWFADNDGTRVRGYGYPHGVAFQPIPPFRAAWNDVAIGMNYRPHRNILLRCETRWDWADPFGASTAYPFDNQTQRNQFLFDTDLIIQF